MNEKMRAFFFLMMLAVFPATGGLAGEFSIERAAVGSSVSPDGCPQLDFELLCESYGTESHSLVAYFFDGETGKPYAAAPGGDHPYVTENGHLGASVGAMPAYSRRTQFTEDFSVPLWAMDLEGGDYEMKAMFYLKKQVNPFKEKLEYIGKKEFDVRLPQGFKKFKDMDEVMIRVNIPSVRERLPDAPAIRIDGLGVWNAFTALPNPRVLPSPGVVTLPGQQATIFVPRNSGIILGGNANWRHEGSADDWRVLHDYLGVQRGVLLPKSRTGLANGTMPRRQILIEPEIREIGDRNVDVELGVDEVRAFSKVPALSDIPAIGQLFDRGRNVRQGRTLIIFVTPALRDLSEVE